MTENVNALSTEQYFLISILEAFKRSKQLTGEEAMKMFSYYDLFDYINKNYYNLHFNGVAYILDVIDEYISDFDKYSAE